MPERITRLNLIAACFMALIGALQFLTGDALAGTLLTSSAVLWFLAAYMNRGS